MEKVYVSSKKHTTIKKLKLRIEQIGSVLLFGLPVAIWLIHRDKKAIYFLPHVGLGDYCIALGYLQAYKEQHKSEHVTLVVPPNRVEVSGFYPHWDAQLVLSRPLYLGIAYLGSLPGGMSILRRFPRIVSITYTLYSSKELLEENPTANADDLVKIILKLPGREQRKPPLVPTVDISSITTRYGLVEGKTVLLNPYTGGCAVKEIDSSFYGALVDKLHVSGYSVATIVGSDDQYPIAGTPGIKASLSEAWALISWCGWLIGTRSGFFDFMQSCGGNIIAIDDGAYKQRDIFPLRGADNTVVKEYSWAKETEPQLIDTILADLAACDTENKSALIP